MTQIVRVFDLDPIADIVLNTVDGNTRRAYGRALLGHYGPRTTGAEPLGFLPWLAERRSGLNRATVNAYIAYLKDQGITGSSINQRLAAIRKFVNEAAENSLIDHPTAGSIDRIKNIEIRGKRAGNWLTKQQAETMLNAPSMTTRKGRRDRAILLGAGLRREEVVALTVEHFQQREGRWVILDLVGKRNRMRTVPIAPWIKDRVDQWAASGGVYAGPLFFRVRRWDRIVRTTITSQAVWEVVREYAPVPDLSPHDLRRTFAKLAHKSGAPIEQIQLSLGHDNIKTTEDYIGFDLDYRDAPSDYIKFDLGG